MGPVPDARLDGRTATPVLRSPAGARPRRLRVAGHPGRPGHGVAEPAYGDLGVDLAAAGAAEPRHPEHRQRRRHDGRGEPPEDLHPRQGRDRGRTRPRGAPSASRQGVPTHSSVPSVNCWCFQIGTSSLSVSISAREAANASPRWAAVGRDDDRDVADLEPADPVDRGDAVHVVLLGDPVADPAQRVERGRVRGVLEPAYAQPVVVVADPADEEGQPAGRLVAERGEHLGDVERGLAEVDERTHARDAAGGSGTRPTLGHRVGAGARPRPRSANARDRRPATAYRGAMTNEPPQDDDPNGANPFRGTPFEQFFGGAGTPDLGQLFSQLQSMMQPYDGPLNWDVAIDIARKTVAQQPDPTPVAEAAATRSPTPSGWPTTGSTRPPSSPPA